MTIRIHPGKLCGVLPAIPSKSDAHRCLICAALADQPTSMRIDRTNADIDITAAAMEALGARVVRGGSVWTVMPIQKPPHAPLLDCGESGSTLRFLTPVAAALCDTVRFTGKGRLPQRPMQPLLAQLQAHGCASSAAYLPYTLNGKLRGGAFELPGNVSSQYITGLLLAAPLTGEAVTVQLSSTLESAGYVDMTCRTMAKFGVRVRQTDAGYEVPSASYRSPGSVEVEGDWSNAAPWLCCGVLGSDVAVTGLDDGSAQGDRAIVSLLRRLRTERDAEIDVSETPDLVPVLAVAAVAGQGTTRLTGAARLRLKESDRLRSTTALLRALGGSAREYPDAMEIDGTGTLAGGVCDACNDHRLVMAAGVAATISREPVLVRDAQAVQKSYPDFFRDYETLGGTYDVVDAGK